MEHTNPPALLLVDIQQGFEDVDYWGGARNNPRAEFTAGEVLAFWRQQQWPIYHVKHNSTNPASPLVKGKPGNAIHPAVAPRSEEPVYEKTVNSAFIGTPLESDLKQAGTTQVVVVGMTTNHCISSTVRMAANLGFKTFLVEDATATFDTVGLGGNRFTAQLMHDTTLASLHQEFAEILDWKSLSSILAAK